MSELIQIRGIEGGPDRRGLLSYTYNFLVQGVDEIEASTMALPGLPSGLSDVGRKLKEWVHNRNFMIAVTVEGILGDPPESMDQYIIQGEKREEPIEAFPDRQALIDEYGAYEDPDTGRLKFPETLDDVKPSGSGTSKSKAKKGEKNPLFGLTTYPVRYKVATRSYVRRTVPASVWDDVDLVTKSLPAGFDAPGNSSWIKDEPITRKRGTCVEIVERWKEIKKLKHIEALHLLLGKRK